VRKRLRENPRLWGNPEFEAVEAARGNQTPAEAALECTLLSQSYRRMIHGGTHMLDHRPIIRHLTDKKIPFVLTGMHGISSWIGRPRATKDVGILVKGGRNFGRAVKALRELLPDLEYREFAGVAGFFPPGEKQSVLDVSYPHRFDLQETLATAIWVEDEGLRFRIPTLEAALANKYGAMLCLTRDAAKRLVDMSDFINMVNHSTDYARGPIDLDKLGDLAETIWKSGGRAEILRMVKEAKAGRIPLMPLATA